VPTDVLVRSLHSLLSTRTDLMKVGKTQMSLEEHEVVLDKALVGGSPTLGWNVDSSRNSLWMLTIRAATASMVSGRRGLAAPPVSLK
jgi:hypothetical protein